MAIRNAMQQLQKQFAAKYGGRNGTLSGVAPKNAVNVTPKPEPRLAQFPDVAGRRGSTVSPAFASAAIAAGRARQGQEVGQNMINPFQQAQQYQGQAAGVFGQMAGFNAPKYRAPTLGAAPTMAGADVQQYMNPYTEEVINRGMADIGRQQQQAMNVLGAQAGRGAFGGDRYQLAEAETAAQFGRQALDFGAQQRQQAFQQAQQQAQFDIGNQMARQQQQLAQQNLAQDEAYRRSLGQIGIRQQGATALQDVGQDAFRRGQFGIQQQQMAAQQQMQQQQQLLDAARLQTLTNLGYPQQSLTFGSGILGGLPKASVTESGNIGLTDVLSFTGLF